MLKQLTIDGGMRDVPEQHKQEKLFAPVRTLPGQQSLEERAPATGDRTPLRLGRCPVKGCAHRTRRDDHVSRAECPDHGAYGLSPVFGAYADTRCDRRCTGATGNVCDCSCGGHNHGRDHA